MTSSFITSFVLHVVFLFLLGTGCCNFRITHHQELEIELASIGDFEKETGGTGLGEKETAQPNESTKETKLENEILPEDKISEEAPVSKEVPVSSTNNDVVNTRQEDNSPGEVIPIKQEKKKVEPLKRPTESVNRPPKKKKNAIIDLLAKERKVDSDFNDLFSDLDKNNILSSKKKNASSKVKGEGGGGGGTALSGSDYELIKKQVIPYWIVPTGIKNYEQYIVRLRVKIRENGQISRSDIVVEDNVRYNSDKLYRVSVDSAKRALLMASPLKIPQNKIRNGKSFLIVFDPRDAL